MKKFTAILVIVFLFAGPAFSQTMQHLDQFEKRKLIVVVEEPDPAATERWQMKGMDLTKLKGFVETYNKNMKAVADKFWDYKANGIEYKTYAELENTKGNYLVLRCMDIQGGPNHYTKLDWHSKEMEEYVTGGKDIVSTTALTICLIEDLNNKPIFLMPMADMVPTKTELIYGITAIGALPKAAEYNKNKTGKSGGLAAYKDLAKKLKDKTLLLREDWIADGLTKDKIAKIYPYKFEIVSKGNLDDIMMEKKPGYAYVILTAFYSNGMSAIYTQQVMDCETGEVYAVSAAKEFGSSKYITEKSLKDYVNGH